MNGSAFIKDPRELPSPFYHVRTKDDFIQKDKLITSVDKNVQKLEHSYTTGRNIKWCGHFGKVWQLLKRLNTALQYDPAIPRLGMDAREMKTYFYKNFCSNIHSSIIHYNQKMETTQMSNN